jgi:hypothetical protein
MNCVSAGNLARYATKDKKAAEKSNQQENPKAVSRKREKFDRPDELEHTWKRRLETRALQDPTSEYRDQWGSTAFDPEKKEYN